MPSKNVKMTKEQKRNLSDKMKLSWENRKKKKVIKEHQYPVKVPEQENVTLTNQQHKAICQILPGFENPNLTPDKLIEGILAYEITARDFSDALKDRKSDVDDYSLNIIYGAIYQKVTEARKDVIKQVDKKRSFYLVDVIIDQIVDDSLVPDVGTGHIVRVASSNKKIQAEIDYLDERFQFDKLSREIGDDLVAYGDYTYKTIVKPHPNVLKKFANDEIDNENLNEKDKKKIDDEGEDRDYGLLKLLDVVEQGSVVALSEEGNVSAYLVQGPNGKIEVHEPADFITFANGAKTIRIDLFKEYGIKAYPKSVRDKLDHIPRFIRVGKSYIFPILSKLDELETLEALVPATKLNKLTQGTVIGVQVPSSATLAEGLKTAKAVEQVLNKKISVDPTNKDISIQNIMATAGKFKVVPLFGEKGQLQKLDYQSDEPDDLLNSIEDIRRVICSSAGVLYELIFGDDDGNKGTLLKRYARYLRKLKGIQKAVTEGIRQIVYIHLANSDISFVAEDIQVDFYHKLIEIDNLDILEFSDTAVSMLNNITEFITTLGEDGSPYEENINRKAYLGYLKDQLGVLGLGDVIDDSKEPEEPDNDDDEVPGEPEPEEEPEEEPTEEPEEK